MTIEQLGQATKAKYPQYSSMDDTEVGRAIIARYPQYQSQLDPAPKQDGFLARVGKDILNAPARVAVGLYNTSSALATATKDIAQKKSVADIINDTGAQFQKTRTIAGNKINPVQMEVNPSSVGAAVRSGASTLGTGVELATDFLGARAGIGAGKTALKEGIIQSAKTGAKTGLKIGAAQGLAQGLQANDASVGSVVKDTALGGIVGGATGGLIGGGTAAVKKGINAASDAVGKLPRLLAHIEEKPQPAIKEFFSNPNAPTALQRLQASGDPQATVVKDMAAAANHYQTVLSKEYGDAAKAIDAESSKVLGLSKEEQIQLYKLVDEHPDLQQFIPAKVTQFKPSEGLNLLQGLNKVWSKIKYSNTPEDLATKDFINGYRKELVNTVDSEFVQGGAKGPTQTLLDNYAKGVAIQKDLGKAFQSFNQNSPAAKDKALKNILSIFEKEPKFTLDALDEVGAKIGIDLKAELAAAHFTDIATTPGNAAQKMFREGIQYLLRHHAIKTTLKVVGAGSVAGVLLKHR